MPPRVHARPDPDTIVHIGDRWMRDVIVDIPDEWVRQIKQGYMCLQCFQRFREAWPDVCTMPGCGYPVKAEQPGDFDHQYRGETRYAKPPVQETLEESMAARGVWLPGGA